MYKWFLAWRYLHTKLIALCGVAGVMLCVAMVLVVMSVMGGFLDTIRERARGLHSEIVVSGRTLQGFPFYEDFGAYLQKELPDVVRLTTPVIRNYGIFRVPATTYTCGTQILGIRLKDYVQVNSFKAGLYYERYYPGTTHLGLQGMPVAGLDEQKGEIRLPEPWESANKLWHEQEPDRQAVAEYDKRPYGLPLYPAVTPPAAAERVYAGDFGDPYIAGPEAPGIIVGADLLHVRRPDGNFDRYVARGASIAVTVMPLTQRGNPLGEPPIRLPLRYADDSRTGIYEIDKQSVYVDFDMLQAKLAMNAQTLAEGGQSPARTNQLLVALVDGVELNEGARAVRRAWEDFRTALGTKASLDDVRLLSLVTVDTWEDLQRTYIAAVEKEKVLVTILFSMISAVAIALLGSIFYMIVEKKVRDIGVLKSLGASGPGVAGLFITYAAAVGVVGAVLGITLGCWFVWNINGIQDYLASWNPELRVWNPEIYSFDKIPEVVKTLDAAVIAVVAVLASMLGAVIPAIVAGSVWPVRALRYE